MDSSTCRSAMSKWVPVERCDGSMAKVNTTTGEIAATLAEVIGLWALDDGLNGLLAAIELEDQGDDAA